MKAVIAIVVLAVLVLAVWRWQGGTATAPRALAPAVPAADDSGRDDERADYAAPVPAATDRDGAREQVAAVVEPSEVSAPADAADVEEPEPWPGACTLHGTVTDEAGVPVELDFPMRAYDEQGNYVFAKRNGADYRFVDLDPGRYWIETDAHEFASPHRLVDVFDREDGRRVDLILSRVGLVDVSLFALDGRPLAKVAGQEWVDERLDLVLVADEPETGIELVGTLADVFRKDSEGAKWGTLRLAGPDTSYATVVLGTSALASQPVSAEMRELTFYIDASALASHWASLRFQVVDENGRPAVDASVFLTTGDGISVQKVSEEGRWQSEELRPGPCELLVHVAGYSMIAMELDLPPGPTDLGILTLEPASDRRGVVVDESGQPVNGNDSNVYVLLESVEPRYGTTRGSDVRLGVDQQGVFVLDLEGDVAIQAVGDELISHRQTVRAGEHFDEEVRLVVMRMSALVLKPMGDAWRGLRYELRNGAGELAGDSGVLRDAVPVRLSCPPGRYKLILRDATGAPVAEHDCTVWDEPLLLEVP